MIDLNRLVEDFELYYVGEVFPIVRAEPYRDNVALVTYQHQNGGRDSVTVNLDTGALEGYRGDSIYRVRQKSSSQPVDTFRILSGMSSWDKDSWVKLEENNDLPTIKLILSDHQRKARETESPFRFMMKKAVTMAEVGDYDKWAEFRFASGEWTRLPWADAVPVKHDLAHHHARFSLDFDTQVAYWPTPADAQRDNPFRENAGTYLTKFYGDVLSPKEIEQWVLKMDPPGELRLSGKDPEDIYKAYGHVDSCMNYRDGEHWAECDGQSPVRIYGAGDLEVATLVRRGQTVGRCLVWPEKMVAGRRYGDIGRLEQALLDAGYTLDSDRGDNSLDTYGNGGLNGARLLTIRPEANPENLVAPYIDFHYRLNFTPDGCFLSSQEGSIAHRTDGLLVEPGRHVDYGTRTQCCDHCGEDTDGDDYTVGSQTWCYGCYDNASYCECCSNPFPREELNDDYVCESCVANMEPCDICGEPTYSTTPLYNSNDSSSFEEVCSSCLNEHGRYVYGSGRYIRENETEDA